MRPHYVINRGISKEIKAVSRRFIAGESYKAVIYNPKQKGVKITADGVCTVVDDRNTIEFTFPETDTVLLKEGYATIEIYDQGQSLMVFLDSFAFIRDNSLQINA